MEIDIFGDWSFSNTIISVSEDDELKEYLDKIVCIELFFGVGLPIGEARITVEDCLFERDVKSVKLIGNYSLIGDGTKEGTTLMFNNERLSGIQLLYVFIDRNGTDLSIDTVPFVLFNVEQEE